MAFVVRPRLLASVFLIALICAASNSVVILYRQTTPMDKNSLRKVIAAQIEVMEGGAFQHCCDRLFSKLHDDYIPVRAGGNKGDQKNDGYCSKQRIFFAAHATRKLVLSKIKDKIQTDFDGCIAKQVDVKKWIFVTNQIMIGDVQLYVDSLRKQHPDVEIETWDHQKLSSLLAELPTEQVSDILDINLDKVYADLASEESQEVEVINRIFEDVKAKLNEPLASQQDLTHLSLDQKIVLNFPTTDDQEEVRTYFNYAIQKISHIERRMGEEDTETQNDLHAYVYSKYREVKKRGLSPIETLHGLFTEILKGTNVSNENLSRAFILFFFDDCTIFEKQSSHK